MNQEALIPDRWIKIIDKIWKDEILYCDDKKIIPAA